MHTLLRVSAYLFLFYYNSFQTTNYLQGISMAPLWDFSKGRFIGVLSALDFILIMKEVYTKLTVIGME